MKGSSPSTHPTVRSVVRPVPVFAPHPLRTARLLVRPLLPSDREIFEKAVAGARTELTNVLSLLRPEESLSQFFARQLHLARLGEEKGTAWRRIGVADDGSIAGGFNLFAISRGLTFEADANWWLSAEHRGRGLGTEGVGAMLDAAFADLPAGLGLHAVHAAIDPANTASIRLAERVGFRREPGTRRVSIPLGDKWISHEMWTRRLLG